MRKTWLGILAGFALAACGGSVTGLPGGSAGDGGSAGTGGHGSGGHGSGGYGTGGYGAGGYGAGGSGGYGTGGYGAGGSGGYGTGGYGTGGYGAGGSGGYGAGGSGGYGAGGSGGDPGCCSSDAECGPNMECAKNRCMPLINGCWRDADCGPNAYCEGASICPCGTLCGAADMPGSCKPIQNGCCTSDKQCAGDEECVQGECEPKLPEYQCWRDSDCPFGSCNGAWVCPCGAGMVCPAFADQPGYCPIPDDAGAPP